MSELVESPITEDPVPPPAVAEEAPPEAPVETAERDLDADTLEIPDSSQEGGKAKYVPAAALAGARKELKDLKAELHTAKEGSAKAAQLEQQMATLQQQIAQMQPYVQAYQAAVQQQPQAEPVAEDDTEAVDLARTLDLYKPDGTPDVERARKTLALMDKRAKTLAEQSVAPIHQMTIQQRSQHNLQRALATTLPDGSKPDPDVLKALWGRVNAQVTADEETAKHLVIQALGVTAMQGGLKPKADAPRGTDGKFAKADLPEPLHTERAGGRDTAPDSPLSAAEKAYVVEMQKSNPKYSEKDYLESARNAPWLRR